MTSHCTVETLSAYLDAELPPEETERLETHVEGCEPCRRELTILRGVVRRTRAIERAEPPSVLGLAVERRIALEAGRGSLGERLERRLGRWGQPSNLMLAFALVFAFAAILFMFADGLERQRSSTIPVVFGSAPIEVGDEASIAGRRLAWDGEVWREHGVEGPPGRVVALGSDDWMELVVDDPELATVHELDDPVLLDVAGQVVLVAGSDDQATPPDQTE